MTTTSPPGEPPREPSQEEIAAALTQLEALAQPEPPALPAVIEYDEPGNALAVPDYQDDDEEYAPLVPLDGGNTKRVRKLRAEVAESHQLADLQGDVTPLLLDTPKVRKRRKKAQEAARLHALSQDPTMRAYTAAKARRRVNTALTVALVLALSWSTAGVQVFASDRADPWSPSWVFAWLVEPFMSIALLAFVGARAFFATRGQPAEDETLSRIERFFLILTLGMNAFPYLPFVAHPFRFPMLVLHLIGPAVAYAVVTGWPRLLDRFATLDHGTPNEDRVTPLTAVSYSGNARAAQDHRKGFGGVRNGSPEHVHRQRLSDLIATGRLAAQPSARAIQRALGCATETASKLRDELQSRGQDGGVS